jgi:hypothetical protein
MADLTQVIRALQYGPLFDMMDRRTGVALLFVNKEISNIVTEYVNLPTREDMPSFAHPAFDLRIKDWPALYLRLKSEEIYINPPIGTFIKCTFNISRSILDAEKEHYIFNIHNYDNSIIDSIILPDKFSWNELITSYQEYVKRYDESQNT